MKKEVTGIDPDALRMLRDYHWPGNVRELENVLERAVILARDGRITASLLPMRTPVRDSGPVPQEPAAVSLDDMERNHIRRVLRQTGFHKSRSAELLGISRKTLDRKIVEYGLEEGE
jgi:transcriptional regulator with PAS, ATPase and Fis domain